MAEWLESVTTPRTEAVKDCAKPAEGKPINRISGRNRSFIVEPLCGSSIFDVATCCQERRGFFCLKISSYDRQWQLSLTYYDLLRLRKECVGGARATPYK